MAWTLLSSPLNLPLSHSAIIAKTSSNRLWSSTGRSRATPPPTRITIRANSAEQDQAEANDKDKDAPAFNPFGFVTDNPSSRSAIQLPESPAEDGNVGQMIYRIEDKGREYGSSIKSGKFRWFVRETGLSKGRRGTIVFLHGAPTQSYSYRVVMSQMSDFGFRCIAPDWIGFGFSDKPQPGYGFDYTEKEFHEEFDRLLDVLGVESPFFLVVQLEKAEVYRLPYLASGGPGFALLEAARKINFTDTLSQIAAGFASERWDKPILLVWGISDKYLPQSLAEEFQKGNPNTIKLKLIEGAGHMPQEDWPEKVVDALKVFF